MCRYSCKGIIDRSGKLWENWLESCPFRDACSLLLKTVHLIYILRKKSYFLHTTLPNLFFNNKISLIAEKKWRNTLRCKCLLVPE